MHSLAFATVVLTLARLIDGHSAAWHKGMYCLNGTSGSDDQNTNDAVNPLYQLSQADWWFHHDNNCDQFPPADGDFLELPAGGNFTVEIAVNRAFTTLSYDGQNTNVFGDGQAHEGLGEEPLSEQQCITEPNIHTQNQSMAAGTAFAISYQSELTSVTPENLVVFSVLHNTPWERLATYQVPAALPACPDDGCICAWGWVPNGCGEPNIYMEGFKCKVTGATGTAAIDTAKPAIWCEDNPSNCTTGARQLIYWQQAEGDNIEVSGNDLSGSPKSPAYNLKLGFANGAQNDIFLAPGTATSQSSPSPSQTSPSSKSDGYGLADLLPSYRIIAPAFSFMFSDISFFLYGGFLLVFMI